MFNFNQEQLQRKQMMHDLCNHPKVERHEKSFWSWFHKRNKEGFLWHNSEPVNRLRRSQNCQIMELKGYDSYEGFSYIWKEGKRVFALWELSISRFGFLTHFNKSFCWLCLFFPFGVFLFRPFFWVFFAPEWLASFDKALHPHRCNPQAPLCL